MNDSVAEITNAFPSTNIGFPAHANTYFAPKNGLTAAWCKCRIRSATENHSYMVSFCGDADQRLHEFPEYHIAPNLPLRAALKCGARVISVIDDSPLDSNGYYAGFVGETVHSSNDFRYLIFFDNGIVRYVRPEAMRIVSDNDYCTHAHQNVAKFLRYFYDKDKTLMEVPKTIGTMVDVEFGGEWFAAVINGICGKSLIRIAYMLVDRQEWMYCGSPRIKSIWLKYRNYYQFNVKQIDSGPASPMRASIVRRSCLLSKPYTLHRQNSITARHGGKSGCNPSCCSYHQLNSKSEKIFTKSGPLKRPLLVGWKRSTKQSKISYVAPCGLKIDNETKLRAYLTATQCDSFDVDNFSFDRLIDCEREFQTDSAIILNKDLSNGIEAQPIRIVNEFNSDEPDQFVYTTHYRMSDDIKHVFVAATKDNLDCCDCTDDCADKRKCSCWQLTMARSSFGYKNKRLDASVPNGVYECNSKCKCSTKCMTRVVQLPMKYRFEVFKTESRGWGVRCLYDLPRGTFICSYIGELISECEADRKNANNYDCSYLLSMASGKDSEEFIVPILMDDVGDDGVVINYVPHSEPKPMRSMHYIVDGKSIGNFGKFVNHSCAPNMFLQPIFVETHDQRFPRMSLFTKKRVEAGTELTFDYNYTLNDDESKPKIYCKCNSKNCRGRVL